MYFSFAVILRYCHHDIGYLTFNVSSWTVTITESSCIFFTTAGSDKVEVKYQQIETKLIEAEDQRMKTRTMAKQGINTETPQIKIVTITLLNIVTKTIALPVGNN